MSFKRDSEALPVVERLMRTPIERRLMVIRHIGLPLVLVGGFLLVGAVVVQSPRIATLVVLLLAAALVAQLWLAKNTHAYGFVGFFVVLTILRPLPSVGNQLVVGRIMDAIWLVLAGILLMLITSDRSKLIRVWPGTYLLLLMSMLVVLSMSIGAFLFQQPVISRDFFELYRGPYYLLIFAVATQVSWSDRQLVRYFFKPLLIGFWIVFGISVVQGLGADFRSTVEYIYTTKGTNDITTALTAGTRVRNSGTFANPNWYGVALAVMFPFLLAGFTASGNRRLRLAIWLTPISAFFFLGISGSRTGVLAGILALFTYVLLGGVQALKRRRVRRPVPMRRERMLLAFTIISVIGILYVFSLQGVRFREIVSALSEGSLLGVDSAAVKWSAGRKWALEALRRSPIFGFGPSKQVSTLLGDNQYSALLYRYGLLGLATYLIFWIAVMGRALRLMKHAKSPLQNGLARAVLASVPAFLLAGGGGAFFDVTHIATLYLLLIGISFSARNTNIEVHRLNESGSSVVES